MAARRGAIHSLVSSIVTNKKESLILTCETERNYGFWMILLVPSGKKDGFWMILLVPSGKKDGFWMILLVPSGKKEKRMDFLLPDSRILQPL